MLSRLFSRRRMLIWFNLVGLLLVLSWAYSTWWYTLRPGLPSVSELKKQFPGAKVSYVRHSLTNVTVLVIKPIGRSNISYVKSSRNYQSSSCFSEWYMHSISSRDVPKDEYDRANQVLPFSSEISP